MVSIYGKVGRKVLNNYIKKISGIASLTKGKKKNIKKRVKKKKRSKKQKGGGGDGCGFASRAAGGAARL